MSTEHTPGPWEAIGNLVRSPMHKPEGMLRGVQIAECRDGYFLAGTDEAKANARLIAAAPELLNALKLVMACAGDISTAPDGLLEMALDDGDEETRNQANAFLVARAAIAKAEGGEA